MTARWLAVLALIVAAPTLADEARIAVPEELAGAVVVGDHAGLTVVLEKDGARHVVVVSQPIGSLAATTPRIGETLLRCPDPEALQAPTLEGVPIELQQATATVGSSYELVAEVVAWVSERIVQDERDREPQDALSVYRRRRGRCSGRANLTVGLLRVLGVPARVVHGVLAADDAVRPHRWGEAWLGEAGWVAFDPGSAVGLVRVRYLPTSVTLDEGQLEGARLLSVDEPGFAALPRWRGMRIRPERGASLRCVTRSDGRLVARLEGPDGMTRERSGASPIVFSDLIPGGYTLRWSRGGPERGPVRLKIDGQQDVQLSLDAVEGRGR